MNCAQCDDTMVARIVWDSWTRDERKAARARGEARVASRGLCSRCDHAARKAGTIIDHERAYTPAAWRAEDYENVRDQLPTGVTTNQRLRVAGRLLGCHHHTLRDALVRAGVAA